MKQLLAVISGIIFLSGSVLAQCFSPLSTPTVTNNGQSGIMFDVQAIGTNSLNMTQLAADFDNGTYTINIYWKTGTHVGFTTNAAAWTLLGSATWTATGGVNVNIPILFSKLLCPGQTNAFYITTAGAAGPSTCNYSNGTAVGAVAAQNADMRILQGTGKAANFGTNFTPRVPNVKIYYTCQSSCCTPPTLTSVPATCSGICNGTATATVGTGGVAPYTYLWNAAAGNQTTQTATGLCAGTYSVTVTDATGCAASGTVTVTSGSTTANTTITPVTAQCITGAPITLTAATPGGTWSGTGITNAATGIFNPSVAGAGTHTITYTIAGACGGSSTTTITVNPLANATITPAGPFCQTAASVTLTAATAGGTWSGTGITNTANGTFDPVTAGPGTYTITYTIGGLCGNSQTTSITVNPTANATITPVGPFCVSSSSITLTAANPGGIWSGTGITNSATGTFDPATAGPGTHTITYTIAGACGDTKTITITVIQDANATITPAGPFCETNPALNLTAVDPGGVWSGTGITSSALGTFDPLIATPGTYTITYTIGGLCGDVETTSITVNQSYDATITPAGPFCVSATPTTLSAADPGGVWSGTGITNAATGVFDPATAGAGTHTITYTIAGACGDTQTSTITVIQDANATITPAGPFCEIDPAFNLTAVDPGGVWSGTGITSSALGTFDPLIATPGTYTITYTIGGLCGDVETTSITVNQNYDATITPAGPFCVSTAPTTLSAADPGGVWSGTGITNAATGVFDPATAGAGTHTITYTIAGACGDTQTSTITVIQDANATITPAGPFCEIDPALNLTAVDPGGVWSGTGITSSALGTFDPVIATLGTYTITYTIGGLCGDVETTSITVNQSYDATITPAGPFCVSTTPTTLSAVDPGGVWSGPGITNAATGVFDPATAGAGTHTITYTIAGACGDTETTTIVVNALDDATITPLPVQCLGAPASVLTAVTGGGTWSGPGITNPTTGTFDATIAGSGIHTITYVTNGQCPDNATTTIEVLQPLTVTAIGAATFCDGQSATVSASGAGGDGNFVYTWTDPTGTAVGTGTSVVLSPNVTTTYTVTLADGCTTPTASDQVTLTVNPIPTANFTTSVTAGCVPLEVIFVNTAPNQASSCVWNFGNGTSSNAIYADTVSYEIGGNYTVSLTVTANGCSNTQSFPNLISAYENPVAAFNSFPQQADILDTEFEFYNESINADSYIWTFGDLNSSTATNPVYAYPQEPGDYTVCLVANTLNGCTDTSCLDVSVIESLIYFIPNAFTPDGNEFNQTFQPVFTSGIDPFNFNMAIYNRWGEVIFESNDPKMGWDGTGPNGAYVQSGMYTWRIKFKLRDVDEHVIETGHVSVFR
jgi:gliding motility-associated-like protein